MSGFPIVGLHEASLSSRAGIVWPGLLIGAGLKARSRLLLPGQVDQPATSGAAAAAAAGGDGQPVLGAGAGAAGLLLQQQLPKLGSLPPLNIGIRRRSSGISFVKS
jgi:hypothetical protein